MTTFDMAIAREDYPEFLSWAMASKRAEPKVHWTVGPRFSDDTFRVTLQVPTSLSKAAMLLKLTYGGTA